VELVETVDELETRELRYFVAVPRGFLMHT
jgi:hypothetical protein